MRQPRRLPSLLPVLLLLGFAACGDRNDVTSSRGALVRVAVEAPASARSGVTFGIRIEALNVGVTNFHDGRVEVVLPAPLTIVSLDPSRGTSATFTNSLGGGRVTWTLKTLDSNSQSVLRIQSVGVLPAGSTSRRVTVVASLTGEHVSAGDAVDRDDIDLTP